MQPSRHDAWVGLFVLIGAAALLFLALKAGNLLSLNFDETYDVRARFDNIGGLKPRAAVKSAGVVIGRVASIAFDDKTYQADVRLQLQKQYAFPKDSSVKILTSYCSASSTSASSPAPTTRRSSPATPSIRRSRPWCSKT